ncbi:hypothetical protein B296_00027560 [Ensete ventricosum]|uniref:Uncharacterized protein n=1 Tax=Ensete ventricosum TaxID=4639 RepID=A0A426Y688_ENSVE|nr:hypothetical protein B296_00027560 [Ensete ventricosum]
MGSKCHREGGDSIHAKASKVGVLEWGLLERWKYHQKCVARGGTKRSISVNYRSPALHTFGSSSQCTGSTCRSPSKQEEFASVDYKTKEIVVSRHLTSFHDADSTDMKSKCSGTLQPPSTIINGQTSAPGAKVTETQARRPGNAEKLQGYRHDLDFEGNWQQLCHDTNNLWHHLQAGDQIRRNSFESYFYDAKSLSLCHLDNAKDIKGSPNIDTLNTFRPETEISTKKSMEKGKESSNHQSSVRPTWMIRSASLRDGSSAPVLVRPFDGSKEASSRRSPLRRMFDTLLKPKNLSDKGGNLTYEEPDDKTRHALLQLAWENGQPMFMFSSTDSDVLAAMLTQQSETEKDDLECIYTIYCIQQREKKSGAWIGLGRKNWKHQLVSDAIGRMNVFRSRNYDAKSHHVTREFVLLGVEPTPPSHGPVDFSLNSELAAIVVDVPEEMAEDNTVIVLPGGTHGSSTDGKPPSLIERWRSGGVCDCGGWDEGCRLTVLSKSFLQVSFNSFLASKQLILV